MLTYISRYFFKKGLRTSSIGYLYFPGEKANHSPEYETTRSLDYGVNDILNDYDVKIDIDKFISEHRSEFVTLAFPEERHHWTDEQLCNFSIDSKSVDMVYYILKKDSMHELCMLLRMHHESRPLYVEILYSDNGTEATERNTLQSSIILTYSVQRFLDHIVCNYDHSSRYCYYYQNTGETWEVEDRDFIFENILVCNAIEGRGGVDISRSWRQQPSPSTRTDMNTDDNTVIRDVILNHMLKDTQGGCGKKNYCRKVFGNIIPFLEVNLDIDSPYYNKDVPLKIVGCCNNLVWKYLADKYSKKKPCGGDVAFQKYYQKKMDEKRQLENKYYPGVCFP